MLPLTRRQMLLATGAGAAGLLLPKLSLRADDKPGFTLPKLPYEYDALEPHIDAETMMIHHDKHHQAYVDNLNKLVAGTEWANKSIDELVRHMDSVPEKIRQGVINNGGGHWNHSFFWVIMCPAAKSGQPKAELARAIETYGGLDKVKKEVNAAATTRFGSGWGWLVVGPNKNLTVLSTANQDDPLMKGQTPILGIDVWEHAYYLKYKNLRAKYLEAWWNVANWDAISENYSKALKG
jgi:superoxide dismutase, Fe-Mn family